MTSTSTEYTMGYSEEFQQLLRRRNAAREAAHLLPHLKPRMRVLDFGCGPGTISMGLAQAIAPGELHGIDIEESQIQIARIAAQAGNHQNTKFLTGDVTALPYEDNFFDAAHCHAVLMHIPDTQRALAEVKRVLKPGGILACRELITSSSFSTPNFMDELWIAFSRLMIANRAHPNMGKFIKQMLRQAGFSNITTTFLFEPFTSPEDITFFRNLSRAWILSDRTKQAMIHYKIATAHEIACWDVHFEKWSLTDDAMAAFAWSQSIAYK